jgi:hypothetical protein
MCLNTFNTQFYIEYITSEFQNTKKWTFFYYENTCKIRQRVNVETAFCDIKQYEI